VTQGLEQQDILASGWMVPHGGVSAFPKHVPGLAFTEIAIRSVRSPLVRISVRRAGISGERKDHGEIRRGGYSALLLAAKARMDVASAVVNSADLKITERHRGASCTL
jgi:hypothetical protein